MGNTRFDLLVRAAARGFAEGLVNLELETAKADLGETAGRLTLTDGKGTVVDLKLWNTPDLVARGHLLSAHSGDSARPRNKKQTKEQLEHLWRAAAPRIQLVRDIEVAVDRQLVAEITAKARPMLSSSSVAPHSASSRKHDGMKLRIYQPDRARGIYTGHALGRRSGELLTFHFEQNEQSVPGVVSSRAAAVGPWIIVIPIVWALVCAAAVIAALVSDCEAEARNTCGEKRVKSVNTKIKTGLFGCAAECEIECLSVGDPEDDKPIFEGTFGD